MSFFVKVMRESISLMSAEIPKRPFGEADPCPMYSKVARCAECWMSNITQFCEVLWCDTMLDVEHHTVLRGTVVWYHAGCRTSHSSVRYCDVIPCWMSNINVQSLNCIRLDTGSQCSRGSHSWSTIKRFKVSKYALPHTTERCLSFLKPHFTILSLGFHPERVHQRQGPPYRQQKVDK